MTPTFKDFLMQTPVFRYMHTDAVRQRAYRLNVLLTTPFENSGFFAKDVVDQIGAHVVGNPAKHFGALNAIGEFILHTARHQPNVGVSKLPSALRINKRYAVVQAARAWFYKECESYYNVTALSKNLSNVYLYTQLVARHAALPSSMTSLRGTHVVENGTHVFNCFDFMETCEAIINEVIYANLEEKTEEERVAVLVSMYHHAEQLLRLWDKIMPYVFKMQSNVAPHLGEVFLRWFDIPRTEFNKVLMVKLLKEIRQFYDSVPAAKKEIAEYGIPGLVALNAKARQHAAWQIYIDGDKLPLAC